MLNITYVGAFLPDLYDVVVTFKKIYIIISCWDNGVLQLVSVQVGLSDQVVESCRAT